ncbi:hypothetical protein MDOR_24640 [Mycolicibacterium doricum]|uniref:Uncharacterized protein n=1 Tax=Mycolicibacterium doricum TaxID=126673 RepID=A0A1X1T6V1_9MYCO|nr:hypothetical protein [Mycolicibacterium doricum]MCV7267178.1 hypothetical protein [Mycolicibacterium doricum]ORV40304.1 hypothetical protein AWC01_12255 [Mycolicibacterium doricum]BBZ08295.1 hypothetical protein MDOR_24640 [Mycolicibacterium doricum]
MTDTTPAAGGILARIRARLAALDTAPAAEPATVEPEPPSREHLFGSQYLVRQSFEETMRQRGYRGQSALLRRRLVARGDGQQQRDTATRHAGHTPGSVMWPPE